MRIREIYFNNFRSFRGEHRISFVDPVTDEVRPVTVLGGSNGTGKTTILDIIEAFLRGMHNFLFPEIKENSLVCVSVEIVSADLGEVDKMTGQQNPVPQVLHFAVGRDDMLPQEIAMVWPDFYGLLRGQEGDYVRHEGAGESLRNELQRAFSEMDNGNFELYGGLIYFPHNRQLGSKTGEVISPPPDEVQAIFHFTTNEGWQGSLEQLWVWQNYLDLEQGADKRDNLLPFVKAVEDALGDGRQISIKKGRVTVPAGWRDNGESPRVHLDQLPSGEQQVLLLFGELARRRRPGVVIAIDEIENSLHPTLQRLVMWNLRKIAREWDAQVIVTTHSAEIINTVRGGAFINLDYPDDQFDLPLPADDELEAA
jgi:energy-coupling factor transporter ATP-binding protein EcfA2